MHPDNDNKRTANNESKNQTASHLNIGRLYTQQCNATHNHIVKVNEIDVAALLESVQ